MDISQVLQELNQRFGLGAVLDVRVDEDEPYIAYIESPRYQRAGRTAQEAFVRTAEAWLRANDEDHTEINEGLSILLDRVRGEGSQHAQAMRQEGADGRDMRG